MNQREKDDLWFDIVQYLQRLDGQVSDREYQKFVDAFNMFTDINTNDVRDDCIDDAKKLLKDLKERLKELWV